MSPRENSEPPGLRQNHIYLHPEDLDYETISGLLWWLCIHAYRGRILTLDPAEKPTSLKIT
jgi:hypothetical protein